FVELSMQQWASHWDRFQEIGDPRLLSQAELSENETLWEINPIAADIFDKTLFEDKVVVDLGAGFGRNTILPIQLGAKLCIAADVSEAIDIAYRKLHRFDNATFLQCDFCALPVIDDSIDFVFSTGVVHHIENIDRGLKEVYRVLCK